MDKNNKKASKFAQQQLVSYLLYSIHIENEFKNFNDKNVILLFEHQKFYFMPVLNYFKRKG